MTPTIRPIGDWANQVAGPLNYAMGAWSVASKKSGDELTRNAVGFMAQSARKLTPQSRARRKIERNTSFGDFVTVWRSERETPVFLGSRLQNPEKYDQNKARLLPINLRGLAKASWGWGMNKLGVLSNAQKFQDRRDVTSVRRIAETGFYGYELSNRLSYITKIMPAGWGKSSAISAANRMNAAAERILHKNMLDAARKARALGGSLSR